VQAEDYQDSIKPGLVAMLPRLKRFADLLAGSKLAGIALLRRALKRMLAEQHRYQRSMPLDRFAFAELYRQWFEELAAEGGAAREVEDAAQTFAGLFPRKEGQDFDPLMAAYLHSLPPQHRATLLLVYGEGFDDIDAGRVLDVAPETIDLRLVRLSASLADCLSGRGQTRARANLARLYAEEAA